MEIAGLPELAAWVAGFGGEFVPIARAHFREMVRERFTRGLERLSSDP